MPTPGDFVWTRNALVRLKTLADRGLSAFQCAEKMTREWGPLNRAQVLGAAFRHNKRVLARNKGQDPDHQRIIFYGRGGSGRHDYEAEKGPATPYAKLAPSFPLREIVTEFRGKAVRITKTRVDGKPTAPDLDLPTDLRMLETKREPVPFYKLKDGMCHYPVDDIHSPGGSEMPCCGADADIVVRPSGVAGVSRIVVLKYCAEHEALVRQQEERRKVPKKPSYQPAYRKHRANSSPWDL